MSPPGGGSHSVPSAGADGATKASHRMSHFEQLLVEYYQWLDHVVKCNVLVGRRPAGGWTIELDVVAYNPKTGSVLHVEPSLDANSWNVREQRFKKKFDAGRDFILSEVFPWLPKTTPIVQRAIFIAAPAHRRNLGTAEVYGVDEMVAEIKHAVACKGVASRAAIPEQFRLLRTIQLVTCGYYKTVDLARDVSRFTDQPVMALVDE
jgi:hypothetical protein